jgi:hypothetical protein
LIETQSTFIYFTYCTILIKSSFNVKIDWNIVNISNLTKHESRFRQHHPDWMSDQHCLDRGSCRRGLRLLCTFNRHWWFSDLMVTEKDALNGITLEQSKTHNFYQMITKSKYPTHFKNLIESYFEFGQTGSIWIQKLNDNISVIAVQTFL